MNDEILDELNQSFVVPQREFRGQKLAPYTEGSRLLLLQVRDDGDSSMYFIYSFIFVHILLEKNRKEAMKICWDKPAFRDRLFEFISENKKSDLPEASGLVSGIIEEASRGQVEIVPEKGGTQGNG